MVKIEVKTYGGKQYKVLNDTWYSTDDDAPSFINIRPIT